VEDVVLDTTTYRTFRAGREIHLSLTEFRLLELLVRNRGAVVSRNSILETLWGVVATSAKTPSTRSSDC
jgi:DNA-binding response OmpR family regulator